MHHYSFIDQCLSLSLVILCLIVEMLSTQFLPTATSLNSFPTSTPSSITRPRSIPIVGATVYYF